MSRPVHPRRIVAILSACHVACLPGVASAHTNAVGYSNAGSGSLSFWYGSYHPPTDAPAHGTEGSIRVLNTQNGQTVDIPFTVHVTSKPSGLVDGVNVFYVTAGGTLGSVPQQAVLRWQGATLNGLTPGSYTFTYVPIAVPTQTWDPVNANVLTFTAVLTAADLGVVVAPIPDLHATTLSAGLSSRRVVRDTIGQRLFDLRNGLGSPGPEPEMVLAFAGEVEGGMDLAEAANAAAADDGRVWVQVSGRRARIGSTELASGSTSRSAGIAAGVDMEIATGLFLGIGAGVSRSDLESDAGEDSRIDGYQMFGYGTYSFGPFFAEGVLAYGRDGYDLRRPSGTGAGTLTGEADGDSFGADLSVGYTALLSGYMVEPSVGVRLDVTRRDEFTETGGPDPFFVPSERTTSVQSRLGARVAKSFEAMGMTLTPEFRAFWTHDFGARDASTAFVLGQPVTIHAADPGRDGAEIGLGLTIDSAESVELFADYELDVRRNATGHELIGGLRIRW